AETRVARAIHFAHPTRTERREDFVGTQFGAGSNGHGLLSRASVLSDAAQLSRTEISRSSLVSPSGVRTRNRFPDGAIPPAWMEPSLLATGISNRYRVESATIAPPRIERILSTRPPPD